MSSSLLAGKGICFLVLRLYVWPFLLCFFVFLLCFLPFFFLPFLLWPFVVCFFVFLLCFLPFCFLPFLLCFFLLLLFPSAALRVVDHHLHASGIIPRVGSSASTNTENRLYEHDWFCVSQAVTCYHVDDLLHKSLDEWTTHSHIWVASVGNSSISFGSIITLDDHILASARRVFVRKDLQGETAPFSDHERYRFEKDCSLDSEISSYLGDTKQPIPMFGRFGTFLPRYISQRKKRVLKGVTIGPQHVNFGNHADHACLAEIAVQALYSGNVLHDDFSSVAIQYISEAFLGDVLDCILHDDRVFLVQPLKSGKQRLVLVARASDDVNSDDESY